MLYKDFFLSVGEQHIIFKLIFVVGNNFIFIVMLQYGFNKIMFFRSRFNIKNSL